MVSLTPGSTLGRYEVHDLIGPGGTASVFRAHDPALDRQVAVKMLPSYDAQDPAFAERFRNEGQSVHPNIVQVHDVGYDKGSTYIVMGGRV